MKTNQPVAYPIFTFRWLTIHALAANGIFPWCNNINAIYSAIGDF